MRQGGLRLQISVCRFMFPHCMQSMAFSGDRFLSAVPGSQHSWAEGGDFSCTSFPLHAPAPRFVPLQGVHVSQQTNCTATSPSPRARGSRRGHSLLGSRPLSPDEWPVRGQHGGVTRHLHRLRSSPPPATPILFCPTVPSFPQASVRSACAAFSSGLHPRSERLFLKAWLAVRGTCESALFS